jgi:hypothetical protein
MTKLAALMSVGVAILTGLPLPLTAQPATRRISQAVDPCAAVGEGRFKSTSNARCEGFWNIYASIPQGDVWWLEKKNGDDPKAGAIRDRINRQAETVRADLSRCGITSYVSLSDWFDTFRGDLVVVHSNPYPSRKDAGAELAKGRACGISGYTKFSAYQITGRD